MRDDGGRGLITIGTEGAGARRFAGLPVRAMVWSAAAGAALSVVVLLLLFVPAPRSISAAEALRGTLMHLALTLPVPPLERFLRDSFVEAVVVVTVALLIVLPVISAARHAAPHRTPSSAEQRREALPAMRPARFTADGAVVDEDGTRRARRGSREWILRSPVELEALAARHRVPWSPRFATEGGARGLLEILRALEDPSPRQAPPRSEISAPPAAPAREEPAAPEPAADPSAANAVADPSAVKSAGDPSAAAPEGDADDDRSTPSWSSGYTGSVYTSTTLYTSSSLADDASEAKTGVER